MTDASEARGRDAADEPLDSRHGSRVIHSIRLGPPWVVTPAARTRNFGWPRTPDAAERVWLVCDHVPGPAQVEVNGTVIGELSGPASFAADVTDLLRQRNTVTFRIPTDPPIGEVSLEVRTLGVK